MEPQVQKSRPTQTPHLSWYYYIIPPLVLAAIAVLVYLPTLNYAFQFDDVANITKHFNIRHNTFNQLVLSGSRWVVYWLNAIHYSIGRFNPFSYRLGTVLIHSINGIFIFFILLLGLTGLKKEGFFKKNALALASITMLLFLLHPVQTQTVSYVIQGELEGLAALTMLGMSLFFLLFCRTHSRVIQGLSLGLIYFFGFFSCGTKEIVIIAPFLVLCVDWFFVAQGRLASLKKRAWLHASIFILIFGIYRTWFKHFAQILTFKKAVPNNIGNIITQSPTDRITAWPFFTSQFKVILHYLWIFIWPFSISVEYDWVLVKGFFAPDCIFPLMGLLVIAYFILKALIANPSHPALFGIIWFFACIAPRSTIVPSAELLVDYKTYLASFGWLFFLGSGIIMLFQHLAASGKIKHHLQAPAYTYFSAILLFALPLGLATYHRNLVWSSGLNFWGNVIKNAPKKARGYNNYGVELSQTHKKYAGAIPYFKRAIMMDRKYPDPCNNLAVCYGHLNKIDDAITALKQGLRINPYYPEGYNNLASFFIQKHEFKKAQQVLQTALKLRPYYGKAYFNLARTYLALNENEKAWECLKSACTKADLDTDAGFAMLGQLSIQQKKYLEAVWSYKKVLALNPCYPEARFNLANAYHLAQQYDQAIALYTQIVQTDKNNIKARYNLGESYFLGGYPQKALAAFNELKKYNNAFPHLHMRIADCLVQLGNTKLAQKELRTCLDNTRTPKPIQEKIRAKLTSLENA